MEENDWIKRLEQLYFTAVHVCHYSSNPGAVQRRIWKRFALCRVIAGKGSLSMDNVVHTVSQDEWFLLKPGMHVEFQTDMEAPVRYQIILFSCVALTRSRKALHTEACDFPVTGKLHVSSNARDIQEMMDTLVSGKHAFTSLEKTRRKHLLHQLLIQLMMHLKEETPPVAGMDRALEYMTHQYMKDIRVEQMARMAGLSVNHFIRTFKRQLNMTPIEYILKQRMAKAKQLLFSSDKIKEIAEQVGYRDEHYFSRVFKKNEGVAPTLYMKNKVSRIATLYYGLDDYVITLGMTPVSALSYGQRVARHVAVPALQAHSHQGLILDSFNQNYDGLRRVQPDLIITSDRLEPNEFLHQIAPTTMLEHTNHFGERLLYMADIMGRTERAEQWIDQHADLSLVLRGRIQSRWGKQSAMFIRVSSQFYRMYGLNNQTGALLYDDLGFHLPRYFPEKQWAVETNVGDMQLYDADHIFVMVDPTEEAHAQLRQLQQSSAWLALKAVQEGRIYNAGDIFFKTLGPTGRMWAMRYVAEQLGVTVR
ncbi:AraC family transcriptional regulator [Paenibacillus sp. SZ31]|uniref:AraC family transcriptional regulator n=1 Tax=Paenibacillus sp. SZ31 TaxID=2725555 RepID=UPI00146C91E4|nr:AraC family transcriptional regulator [Paenibacillus sp. SZ31]NMI02774.1 AraC family transcriptional regulator [Paenibacillus sp. SZ31]